MEAWVAEQMDGGGGDGRDRDGDRRLIQWEDTVQKIALEMEPNYPLAYALVLKLHHPNTSTIESHGGKLEKER